MSHRKDISEHVLNGTTARHNTGLSSVAGSLPRPPKDLSKEEKKRFRGYVKTLADRRAVTSGDGTLLAILCRTESRCQIAQAALLTEGLVRTYQRLGADGLSIDVEKPNLYLKIIEVAERSCVQILVRLGLTPKDREGVRPTSPAKPKNAPPDPNSREGIALEVARLQGAIAAEREQAAAASTTDDPDLNSEELLRNMEEIS